MKTIIIICLLVICSGCSRAVFRFNDNGKLVKVKEPRLQPGKGYPVTFVFSVRFGEEIKTIK